ncbi:unnamed protein product [Ixodes pacificus]
MYRLQCHSMRASMNCTAILFPPTQEHSRFVLAHPSEYINIFLYYFTQSNWYMPIKSLMEIVITGNKRLFYRYNILSRVYNSSGGVLFTLKRQVAGGVSTTTRCVGTLKRRCASENNTAATGNGRLEK